MSEAVVIGALIAGYPVLTAAIGILYRDLRKSQEARMQAEKDHMGTLENMLKIANDPGSPTGGDVA